MNNQDLIVSQIRQRLEILYQMVNELEGGGGSGDAYTKAQTDALLDLKADKSSTYTKTEVNTALSNKANTTDMNEIFAIDSISIEEGESLPSTLSDWLRLHKPINLNGVEYYFSEESGVEYIYKAIDHDGALPKFSVAQILKGNFRVQFYDTTVDLVPTADSINLITSDAVYDALALYDTWTTYDNQLSVPTTFTNIDTANSSISIKVNTKLRRVVGIISIKFSTAWSGQAGGTRIARLNMEGALSLAPLASVRVYAATSDYLVGIIKPANSTDININVYNGEIPVNTTINAQIEWTY